MSTSVYEGVEKGPAIELKSVCARQITCIWPKLLYRLCEFEVLQDLYRTDKPCVPNFIEDQSFDEIRWICYEAKKKNCFDQFVKQFAKEAIEANNKMKTMAQISPHVVDIICRLYDATSEAATNVGLTKSNKTNPFGLEISVASDTALIFKKPGATSSSNKNFGDAFNDHGHTTNAGCVFGGMAPSTPGGIFGGGRSAFNFQNQQSSVFSQQLPNASSIFGGGAPQNLFGQTLTSTDVTVGRFGRAQQGTGGLFSQSLLQQHQIKPSSIVGLCSSQAQQNAGGSLFNQSIQKQQITNGGNVFTQSTQSQQMQTPPNFGMYQSNKQEAQSVFVQQNVFSQQTPGCIFGQVAQTTSSANLNNLFAQSLSAPNGTAHFTNTAAIPSQSVFVQALCQNQNTPANIFSQPDETIATTSVSMEPPTNFFQQTPRSNQSTAFGKQVGENTSSQALLQSPVVSSSVYSKLADLTPDEIEAFKADAFTPRKIPNVPPPPEFIN
ncbi:LOW QUALITY PROTEIN: nucleoporin-like protein amo1 [Rhagoletis pomonella]|uniref:LOW QUALITY PROTEIN: nucleoporin-like protein amo1 n=1 Tax=Rhagoletis pomonella TaxID=28610 RepID=UPI00177F31C2|nr:LOW QUALITY PROTEIN: nucleoporin-like protein amo1 [Rhagoletis pomonella]